MGEKKTIYITLKRPDDNELRVVEAEVLPEDIWEGAKPLTEQETVDMIVKSTGDKLIAWSEEDPRGN